jgi:hypothetical protein
MEMAKTHSDDERSAEKLRDQKTVKKSPLLWIADLVQGSSPPGYARRLMKAYLCVPRSQERGSLEIPRNTVIRRCC